MDLHSSHEIKRGYLYQTYLITLFQVSDIKSLKMKLICGTLTRLIFGTMAQCAVWQNVSYGGGGGGVTVRFVRVHFCFF